MTWQSRRRHPDDDADVSGGPSDSANATSDSGRRRAVGVADDDGSSTRPHSPAIARRVGAGFESCVGQSSDVWSGAL